MMHVLGRLVIALLILAAGAGAGAGLIAIRSIAAQVEAEPRVVGVVRAHELETFVAKRRFAGRVVPRRSSDLAFELGGRITALRADDGDTVTQDQPLAQLDPEQLLNRKAELEGQKREVEAELTRAEAALERAEDLAPRGFTTEQQLDSARAARDAALARLRQIEAALRTVERDLENTILLAPFDGQIVRRFVDEGTVVQAGTPVMRLDESGTLEARIGVPIVFSRQIQVGGTYEISTGLLSAQGTVTAVVSDVNTQTRTLTVILEITDDPGFVARDLVRLTLTEEIRETGIWVPATALNESLRGLWAVFVVDTAAHPEPDLGVVVRKDVEIVHIEENRVYVRGALQSGDLVIASSVFRVVPGQTVRIDTTALDAPDGQDPRPVESTDQEAETL